MSIIGTCRGCGAQVRWVQLPTQSHMPLDPDPIDSRYIPALDPRELLYKVEGIYGFLRSPLDHPAMEYHRTHWATCPVGSSFHEPKQRPEDKGQLRLC